jgi:formylmethanofuran dehydrogenase subunit D
MTDRSELQVTLLTGRTIEQGVGKERGKWSKEYLESVAVCYMDPADLKKLGVREKSNVLVSTEQGSVVVKALRSPRAPHAGVIYIPYGPWANAVVDPKTDGIGMPSFKGIPAKVRSTYDRPFLTLSELLEAEFGKEKNGSR